MNWSKKLIILSLQFCNSRTKVLIKPAFLLISLFLLSSIQTSCQPDTRKSILILAFDELNSERVNCSEDKENENSGFAILCQESIHFTHAYSTSLQPAAALTSILTGQYPLIHKLHRSYDQIDPQIKTLSEAAFNKGYRTGFFAGNPHVLKKTGLAKFFEIFDDSAAAQYSNQIIKDFNFVAETFIEWQQEDKKPFFAVLTNSEVEALNDSDTQVSSFEKLDEKLFNFISNLKSKNIWDNTSVFVVGLKGSNVYNRLNESNYQNLHSENTAVSFLVKPSKNISLNNLKNDTLVNLADIGKTLFSFFGASQNPNALADFPLIDLSPFLFLQKDSQLNLKPESQDRITNRPILTESANTLIKNPLKLEFSALNSKVLVLTRNEKFEAYNLLNDQLETIQKSTISDTDTKNLTLKLKQIIKKINGHLEPTNIVKIKPDETLKNTVSIAKNFLKNNSSINNLNSQIKITENNPLYIFNLNQKIKSKKFSEADLQKLNRPYYACIKILNDDTNIESPLKLCVDPLFVDFIKYKHHLKFGLNAEKSKLAYELSKKRFFEEIKIQIWNLASENIWGLWDSNKSWYHPLVYLDPNFMTQNL